MAEKVAFSKGPGSCCGGARPPDPVPSFTGEAKEVIEVRTVVLIFNPFSGPKKNAGHIVETIVVPMFKDASIEVRLLKTQHKAHAIELARTADLTKVDGLLALGGDGTFSEVLTGLKMRTDGARPPLGFLPGGTGNNFCRHYLLDDRAASAVRTVIEA
jgi:diacylglycerol kinase family enzyme